MLLDLHSWSYPPGGGPPTLPLCSGRAPSTPTPSLMSPTPKPPLMTPMLLPRQAVARRPCVHVDTAGAAAVAHARGPSWRIPGEPLHRRKPTAAWPRLSFTRHACRWSWMLMASGRSRAGVAGGEWRSRGARCHPTSSASVSTVSSVTMCAPSALSCPSASTARGRVTRSETARYLQPLVARKANEVVLRLAPLDSSAVPVSSGLHLLVGRRRRLLLRARSPWAGSRRCRLCVSCQLQSLRRRNLQQLSLRSICQRASRRVARATVLLRISTTVL